MQFIEASFGMNVIGQRKMHFFTPLFRKEVVELLWQHLQVFPSSSIFMIIPEKKSAGFLTVHLELLRNECAIISYFPELRGSRPSKTNVWPLRAECKDEATFQN